MFKGDIGKVRKVIAKFGLDTNCIIFNDKRKTFRRLKIWFATEEMNTDKFKKAIADEFNERFICTEIKPFIRQRYTTQKCMSFIIYLDGKKCDD